jgi:hypothetical protein
MDSHHNKNKHNPAFVLGNGRSRLALKDPKKLLEIGTVYGCNALYREMNPHYLVAVDVKMVNEIVATGYHKTNQLWTNPNKGITAKIGINYFNPHKGWSSGPTALWLACNQGHKEIYILGFDYMGLQGRFNNVYADTFNYKKSTDSATFHGNWLTQTEKVIKEYKSVNFYRAIEPGGFVPDRIGSHLPNIKHVSYEDLGKIFPIDVYLDQNLQKTII